MYLQIFNYLTRKVLNNKTENFPLHYISKSVNNFFPHAHFSQCIAVILSGQKERAGGGALGGDT
jgi:hypothetical protein